jgi:hypothetical protein
MGTGMLLFIYMTGLLSDFCSPRCFKFMFLRGIGGTIRCFGIRGGQFYITIIGLIIIIIIEVIAIAGRHTYTFLRITLIM